mgnify:FL=1
MIIDRLFEGCDIETGVDYLEKKDYYDSLGEKVVYTGTIDAYYKYQLASWNTAVCVLNLRFWMKKIIRVWQLLTIQTARLHTPALSNISTLSLAPSLRQ